MDAAAAARTNGMPAMAMSPPAVTRKVSGRSVPMYNAKINTITTHPDVIKAAPFDEFFQSGSLPCARGRQTPSRHCMRNVPFLLVFARKQGK